MTSEERIIIIDEIALLNSETLKVVSIAEHLGKAEQTYKTRIMQMDCVSQLATLYSKMLTKLLWVDFRGEQYNDTLEALIDCSTELKNLTDSMKILHPQNI